MFLGLSAVDLGIIFVFLASILALGFWAARGIHGDTDFFVAGRKMGGWLQFFLNFGQMSDSNSAPIMTSEVYRQGIGGIWIGFQLLLMSPFYWFSSIWFRRSRQITLADLFADRFGSPRLAAAYSIVSILLAILTIGLGNVVSYKVVAALMVKPEPGWTASERRMVDNFHDYRRMQQEEAAGKLPPEERERYASLSSLEARGELSSFVSYVRPLPFYLAYTLMVGSYVALGGIKAAALTDAIQGVLIVIFSLLLIPIGLWRIGGFRGLHRLVDPEKFNLFSSAAASDYTWYSVGAIIVFGLLGLAGMTTGPAAAAARDERAARMGVLAGAFAKRLLTLAWAFSGLLALAVLGGGLSDPDAAWGRLSAALLMPGLLGLMLSGMLLGHMPAVGVAAMNVSALFSRTLYRPLVPGRSPAHYLAVAKISVFGVLLCGTLAALLFSGVVSMIFTMWLFGAIFSATFALLYFWRRLTAPAIALSWLIWMVLLGVLPWVVPEIPPLRQNPALLLETEPAAGRGEPRPLFFDSIARIEPLNPHSAREGIGRFNMEGFLLHLAGVPLQQFRSAGLMTARWLFDTFVPFLLLMLFSLLPQRADPERDRCQALFFAKMKTPVAPTPEEDERELALNRENPGRFDHLKLFPGTNWEFTKWSRHDLAGFCVCWGIVLAILGLLGLMVTVGA